MNNDGSRSASSYEVNTFRIVAIVVRVCSTYVSDKNWSYARIIAATIKDGTRQAGQNLYSSHRFTVYILNIRTDMLYHSQSDQNEHCIYFLICRNTNSGFHEGLDVGDAGMRLL